MMTLLNKVFDSVARAAFLMGMLCIFACCDKLNTGVQEELPSNFKLSFLVPGDTKATSAADYSDPMNNEGTDNLLRADDLEIYFFDTKGGFVSCVKDVTDLRLSHDSSLSSEDGYHLYNVEMHVDGIVNGGIYRVVVLANRRSHLGGAFPFCTPANDNWLVNGTGSTDEEKLYSTLKFNYSSTGTAGMTDYIYRNFVRDEMAYVPMWGLKQLKAQVKLGDTYPDDLKVSGTIDMLRSLAKVKVNIEAALTGDISLTSFNPANSTGGMRLCNPVREGWMTPAYDKVKSLTSTPDIINKDREGGVVSGSYSNEWVHKGESSAQTYVYPFYRHTDGSYYTYLPEANIGEAWIGLEFEMYDSHISAGGFGRKDYRLEFADYKNTENSCTENQIDRFPVMRNHYYIYTITRLNPLVVRYEVCDWNYKETEIVFN